MKSKLQNRINQAEHLIIIGPQTVSLSNLAGVINESVSKKLQIIYLDGGTKHIKQIQELAPTLHTKSFSLGDNDSSMIEVDELKIDQNVSDLSYLLEMISSLQTKLEIIHFFGFLGHSSRIDHILVNFGEISHFQKQLETKVRIVIDKKIYFLNKEIYRFTTKGLFSLLVLKPGRVKISGQCAFPFEGALPVLSSRGLSNLGRGEVLIECKGQCLLILSKK